MPIAVWQLEVLQEILVGDYIDINHDLFQSMRAVAIPRSDNFDEWQTYTSALEKKVAQAKNASSSSDSPREGWCERCNIM